MIFARLWKKQHANGNYALEGQTHRDVPANTPITLKKEDGSFNGDPESYVIIELGERRINTSEQSLLSFVE